MPFTLEYNGVNSARLPAIMQNYQATVASRSQHVVHGADKTQMHFEQMDIIVHSYKFMMIAKYVQKPTREV